jgi:tripartite-type tricarboxylate transporter receptor subunit TctC
VVFKKLCNFAKNLALVVLMSFPISANADFSGKTITILVPFGEGGGTTRVFGYLAPFIQKHLPGNPMVKLLNVPGGGSIKGANQFHNNQLPDGTYLLASSTSTVVNQAVRNPLVEYDLSSYKPVVLIGSETHWFTSTKVSPNQYDFSPLLERKLTLYALNSPSSADLFHVWVFDKLGVKGAKPIPGLSSGQGYQAFLRGEIQISSHGSANYLKRVVPGIKDGEVSDLMSFGLVQPNGEVLRTSYSQNTPTFPEQYERINGKKLAGDDLETYLAINGIWNRASKALFLPSDTSDDMVKVWRDAFEKIAKDPEFISSSEANLGPSELIIGELAGEVMNSAAVLSDVVVGQLNEVLAANRFTFRIE